MQTSQIGINLIQSSEGVRLAAYRDVAGIPTIGYGHTAGVEDGATITQAQAERLLAEDLRRYESAINSLVKVPLEQPQFDALVSFAFNVGEGALRSSTLLAKLNASDFVGAMREFLRWDKATVGGHKKPVPGLTRRRRVEAIMFGCALEKVELVNALLG